MCFGDTKGDSIKMKSNELDCVYRVYSEPYHDDSFSSAPAFTDNAASQKDSCITEPSPECILESMTSTDADYLCDGDPHVTVVPNLQAMSTYIKFHYTRTISRDLCRWIEAGEGYGLMKSDFPTACRDTVQIEGFDFWWSGRTKLTADVQISVDVVRPGYDRPENQQYIVSLFFDFQDRIRLVYEDFSCLGDYLDRSGMFRLSRYLVPIFRKEEIDKQAENLLRRHNEPAWKKQRMNQPEQLADNLRLTIRHIPLYGYGKIRSILFFKDDNVDEAILDERGKVIGTRKTTVRANTIVINVRSVRSTSNKLDIYHECIHYEWHYMFFKLQDMYNNDLRTIEKKKGVFIKRLDPEKKESNPLCWIEHQARRGSFGLWMPVTTMNTQIRGRMADPFLPGLNTGQVYQKIAKGIASEFNIPKFRVRARLIQLGHWNAMGCLNYEDDHYMPPSSCAKPTVPMFC